MPVWGGVYANNLVNHFRDFIANELEGETVTLTTDLWTSVSNDHYLAVTAHFIDDTWSLRSRILGAHPVTAVSATAAVVQASMSSVLSRYRLSLDDIHALAADRGSNIVKMVQDANVDKIDCLCHKLDNG